MRKTNKLTHERLIEVLDYEPKTGVFAWRHNVGRFGRIPAGSQAGALNHEGYRYITIDGAIYRASRLAFFFMKGEWPKHQVDHKNRDTGDDSWENLREATPSQNKRNSGIYKNNTTGYKCVTFDKDRGKYTVRLKIDGVYKRLGRFDTAEEAYAAYLSRINDLHGEFANTGGIH